MNRRAGEREPFLPRGDRKSLQYRLRLCIPLRLGVRNPGIELEGTAALGAKLVHPGANAWWFGHERAHCPHPTSVGHGDGKACRTRPRHRRLQDRQLEVVLRTESRSSVTRL